MAVFWRKPYSHCHGVGDERMSINCWGSDDPAEVAKGGTGNATLTDHGVLLGSGTSPVTVTTAGTNGQLLLGATAADPAFATVTGDTNEISLTAGAGTLAVGLADNLVFPGTGSYKWVDGTTAQEPSGSGGEVRYDMDTDTFRGYIDGTGWVDFATGSGGDGMWTLISDLTSVASGTTINLSGYIAYSFYIRNFTAGTGADTFDVVVVRGADSTSTDHTSLGYNWLGTPAALTSVSGGAQWILTPSLTWADQSMEGWLIFYDVQSLGTDYRVYCASRIANVVSSNVSYASAGGYSRNGSSTNPMSGIQLNWPGTGGSPTADVSVWGLNL